MSLAAQLRRVYRQRLAQQAATPALSELRRPAIVFAPHPDDETLACGGIIAMKRRAGAAVTVVFLTDGRSSHAHLMPADELAQLRRQEACAACHCLGVEPEDVLFLDFPDGDLKAHESEAARRVRAILSDRQPSEVYVPYRDEPPPDHVAACHAVMRALHDHPMPMTVYDYPVWYWNHWPWTHLRRHGWRATADAANHTVRAWFGLRMLYLFPYVVDVSDTLADKRDALAAHRTQMTRVRPEVEWPILADVADGKFLACFMQPFELFRRHETGPGHPVTPIDPRSARAKCE